ncbi:hypothetical protein N7465_004294 [Penicillium sp. CMV-2018d]|nr:hypothetical protein N7465_004294 [Penicillium sp. CMV-2018d]
MQRQQAEVSKGMRGLVYAVDDTIAHNNADTHAEGMECAQGDVEAAAAVDIGKAIYTKEPDAHRKEIGV